MPSPFPGMNPYLERVGIWHDFHERFIPLAAEMLGGPLAPKYVTHIDEHVYIREMPLEERRLVGRGDVTVHRTPVVAGTRAGTVAVAPARVQIPQVDMEHLSFLEIRDRDNWEVVTVIELLSPANKYAGADREQYLAKRSQLLASAAHFVEIDLLRGGPRLPLKPLPDCDYYVMVSRVEERPEAGLWPIRLREPLPAVPIPLRSPDADVELDLQAALHRIYDAAHYELYAYREPPEPRLSAEDAAWAQQYVPPGLAMTP
jgi:hypothetical protein